MNVYIALKGSHFWFYICIIWLASNAFTLWWTSHGWVTLTRISFIIQQIRPGTAQSDSPQWHPTIDDHLHGWVILPSISLILHHILIRLVSSGLPRMHLHSDEQVTVEWLWLVFHLLSNRYDWDLHHRTPPWLPHIAHHRHYWEILLCIFHILSYILVRLLHRTCLKGFYTL